MDKTRALSLKPEALNHEALVSRAVSIFWLPETLEIGSSGGKLLALLVGANAGRVIFKTLKAPSRQSPLIAKSHGLQRALTPRGQFPCLFCDR